MKKNFEILKINVFPIKRQKPINTFCRKNFVNYNSIADKIIKMSQPYGEESNANQLIKEKILEENKNNINEINEEDKFVNNFYKDNLAIISLNPRDVSKFVDRKNMSNIADKNTYINNNITLKKIRNSDLSLFKKRSDISLKSAFHSDNNF